MPEKPHALPATNINPHMQFIKHQSDPVNFNLCVHHSCVIPGDAALQLSTATSERLLGDTHWQIRPSWTFLDPRFPLTGGSFRCLFLLSFCSQQQIQVTLREREEEQLRTVFERMDVNKDRKVVAIPIKSMTFVFKLMNFSLKMMNFVLKMMNSMQTSRTPRTWRRP